MAAANGPITTVHEEDGLSPYQGGQNLDLLLSTLMHNSGKKQTALIYESACRSLVDWFRPIVMCGRRCERWYFQCCFKLNCSRASGWACDQFPTLALTHYFGFIEAQMVGDPSVSYRHIRVAISDGVANIILSRPDVKNVLGIGPGSSRDEIADAFLNADNDDEVGCLLLTAEGNAFCAGGDLTKGASSERPSDERDFYDRLGKFYSSINSVRKPIVMAVNGLCLGAGLGLIAQADIVIAGEDARFGLIEGRIGHPGASEIVPIVGLMWAKFMILTGELLTADRAREIGLVLEVLPADSLVSKAQELARRIATIPRVGSILNKAAINAVREAQGREAGRTAARAIEAIAKFEAREAHAPDGALFEDVLRESGVSGLKAARDQQFKGGWLREEKKK